MSERIQKILREWGIASRREAETMITEGRVKVNGVITQLGDKANAVQDKIEVDGKILSNDYRPRLIYFLLNKPKGYISTCEDPQGRKTVMDLLPPHLKSGKGIHPVGRLDRNSTGALLLTNDGSLTVKLTHPRYDLPKTYLVTLEGNIPNKIIQQWAEGFMWEGKQTLPAEITINKRSGNQTQMEIILREGRYRQIRRIAELFGYPVVSLHRKAIGTIKIASLSSGKYRTLTIPEMYNLKKTIREMSKN
ncbi:MAG: rRNA pseudouridine synthase [Cyanobacteria bacterium]|nr:rRNA pseudouridine synthase [Cyanobacteria bacterium CG_2015-16_32_12]NCO79370.1 rRNA pseudouridine synthase [Cyanobacteria bacterium CG_2015-22_32_23]NCQ05460.1 rRNA pseudouridine synthase [Cyanobacteria bacterium CG_2015-09_32_10]NCQ41388.1 rRNA pseudouridine synthase [Cyanobacteria bacterium CG_2015-04_32_10]NCS85644.1 rRNA pseudouridine synthase [Cyanobacteria bacterium CG_2015-02_32_10]